MTLPNLPGRKPARSGFDDPLGISAGLVAEGLESAPTQIDFKTTQPESTSDGGVGQVKTESEAFLSKLVVSFGQEGAVGDKQGRKGAVGGKQGRKGTVGGKQGRLHRLFSKKSLKILTGWFDDNLMDPYPTDLVKDALAKKTGLLRAQVNQWFVNKRKRDKRWKKFKSIARATVQQAPMEVAGSSSPKTESPLPPESWPPNELQFLVFSPKKTGNSTTDTSTDTRTSLATFPENTLEHLDFGL